MTADAREFVAEDFIGDSAVLSVLDELAVLPLVLLCVLHVEQEELSTLQIVVDEDLPRTNVSVNHVRSVNFLDRNELERIYKQAGKCWRG